MHQHLFIRGYMAGIVPPTAFALVIYLLMSFARQWFTIPVPPVERFVIFPLVVVPNLWGIWNGLRAVMPRKLSLAAHGALLPIVNFAIGMAMINFFHIPVPEEMQRAAPISFALSMPVYYLVWKYIVGFLNSLVDVD